MAAELSGKRLHPLWIPFAIGKSIKDVLIPFIILFVLNFNSDSIFARITSLFIIGFLIYSLITSIFYWKNFRYMITDNDVTINEGRLKTKKRYIALERIQSVQQNTTFFHKIVGLTSLTMLTGTTDDNSSVKLEMITEKEVAHIQAQLKERRKQKEPESETEENTNQELYEEPIQKHYVISKKEIFQAAFTSFTFLAFIGVLFTIYVKVDDVYPLDDKVLHWFGTLDFSWIFIAGIIFILLLLSSLFGVLYIYLRFGDFQVHSNQERIFIKKGILNKTHFTIPKAKINAIKFNKSFIRRWVGIVEVELITAGSLEEDDLQTSILFPFISEKRANKLIPEVLPAFRMNKDMTKMPRPAVWINLLRTAILTIVVSIIIILIFPDKWYFSFPVLGVISLFFLLNVFHSRYEQTDSFIQIRRGAFSSHLLLTTKQKIAELEVAQSWIQRRFGLASLMISTRAKPILVFTISDMPKSVASTYYKWYAKQ